MGVELRALGTTATYAPVMKRAAHRLSGGRSVMVVPDTNRSDANGDDVTGTAKIHIYVSTDSTRSAFALDESYTPAVAPSSSTKAFVGSSTTRENDNLYVVYQGTDNSLRLITFTWGGSSYGAGSEQTIIAANAVTNRFRSVDIDALPTNSALGVMVYEASASSGQGAYVRAYVRLTDDTTWIKAWESQVFTTQFLRDGAADVSIAWDKAGATASVGKLALYYTQTHTTGDSGDAVREISFNVASGTANSATLLGSWLTNFNSSIASSTRRGFLFGEGSGKYVFGSCIGSTTPVFKALRLRAGTYTGLVVNQTSVPIQAHYRLLVWRENNSSTAVSADYCDGRLVFGYSGLGLVASNYQMKNLVFIFSESDLTNLSAFVDTDARVADGGYALDQGVLGVYGGGSKYNYSGFYALNFMGIYGSSGNDVSASPSVYRRRARSITEDTFSAPVLVAPINNPGVDTPVLRAEFQNESNYSNLRGKMHWQFATDSGFTTDVVNVIQADSTYYSYSTTDGTTRPTRIITQTWPSDVDQLFGEFWNVRVRVVDDLGGFSDWSVAWDFTLSHPPTALPTAPADNAVSMYTTGDTFFAWQFSDTESTDSQTAYQVVVVRTDTGATVHDTGKVSSSVNGVWIDLAGTLRGLPLQWQVSLWDEDDNQGAFSNARLFTVMDNPSINITSPSNGDTLASPIPTVVWTFSADNGRTQRAYRVQIFDINPDPPESVADSGWIISADSSHVFLANVLENLGNYRIVVDVQDNTGLYASVSDNIIANQDFDADVRGWTAGGGTVAHTTAFIHSGTGALLLDPTGGADADATADYVPVIVGLDYEATAWIYMPGGYAGDIDFSIIKYDSAGSVTGTSTNTTTGITAGTWTLLECSAGVVGGDAYAAIRVRIVGTPLTSDLLYLDEVTLTQEAVEVDTSWTPPALGDTVLTQDEFRVYINWTDANLDVDFVSWRVYRRYMVAADAAIDFDSTASTWVLIDETTDNSAAVEYQDFMMPLNKSIDYVVVQVVDRFGSLIESDIDDFETIVTAGDRYYFVPATPIGAVASFEASSVNADNFVREVEQEKLHVIQRGRQIQVGDDLGYEGSLTIRLRSVLTSRRDREFFEYLSTADAPNTYIKSPFGDVFLTKIGVISTVRVPGVGTTDMVDLTVPYSQAFEDVVVTRTV